MIYSSHGERGGVSGIRDLVTATKKLSKMLGIEPPSVVVAARQEESKVRGDT